MLITNTDKWYYIQRCIKHSGKHLRNGTLQQYLQWFVVVNCSLLRKCPYSVFSCIRTECGVMLHISLYSARMREIRTRVTPNTNAFHAVIVAKNSILNISTSSRYTITYIIMREMELNTNSKLRTRTLTNV